MKFKNLVIGEIYQDENGIYRFVGMRNDNIAEFEERGFDNNDELFVIVDTIYKTENDMTRFEVV